ncbi:MAG: YraN family protein [Patescibacteria group bacterium]|nr:YraN family protein [Patescibacteria group bacterium]
MKTRKQIVGQLGEKIAKNYLVRKDYRIIDQNYRQTWGEIDIIAKKSKTWFFVEVKTMIKFEEPEEGLTPEDQMTQSKIKKLNRTILGYLNHFHIDEKWQLDLIAIEIDKEKRKYHLRRFEQVS